MFTQSSRSWCGSYSRPLMKIVGVPCTPSDSASFLSLSMPVGRRLRLHVGVELREVEADLPSRSCRCRPAPGGHGSRRARRASPRTCPGFLAAIAARAADSPCGCAASGEVLVDEADVARVPLPHLLEHGRFHRAEGALEVGELDERDRRVLRPLLRRAVEEHVLHAVSVESVVVALFDLLLRHAVAHAAQDVLRRRHALASSFASPGRTERRRPAYRSTAP